MNPIRNGKDALFTLAGGNVAESIKITFKPSSHIPMSEFDPETGRGLNKTYLLHGNSKDYPKGYTLIPAPDPEGILPDTLLIIKEILNEEGRIVGMPQHSWESTFDERGFFGVWSYLELDITILPSIVVVEKSQVPDEEPVQPQLDVAVSS